VKVQLRYLPIKIKKFIVDNFFKLIKCQLQRSAAFKQLIISSSEINYVDTYFARFVTNFND